MKLKLIKTVMQRQSKAFGSSEVYKVVIAAGYIRRTVNMPHHVSGTDALSYSPQISPCSLCVDGETD